MNKLVSLSRFSKQLTDILPGAFVVVNQKNYPLGYVFGNNAFISLLTKIDGEFEDKVVDPKKAYDNYAGRLIDLIEGKLPVNSEFSEELKESIKEAKREGWIPFEEIVQSLNV